MNHGLPAAETLRIPYTGLRPFEPYEAALFFGRADQIEGMLVRLETNRFLAVVGASGCGKSSLVRAGLLPALADGFLMGAGDDWRFVIARPGDAPLANLAQAIATAVDGPHLLARPTEQQAASPASPDPFHVALIENALRGSRTGLVDALAQCEIPATTPVLVLIDQFEELFRFRDLVRRNKDADTYDTRNEAMAFVDSLLQAVKQMDRRVYVVITMRSEFMGDCDAFPGLPEGISDSQFLAPRMTRSQLSEAITGPLEACGYSVEPGLVNRVLNDIGSEPDQLPLAQHVLRRMWMCTAKDRRRELTFEDYRTAGGIRDSIAKHGDEILATLQRPGGPEIARVLFMALCEQRQDGPLVRRLSTRKEVEAIAAEHRELVPRVIAAFGGDDPGFIHEDRGWLDARHEAILRQWPLISEWRIREAESATWLHELAQAAKDYEKGPEGTELWGGNDLRGAEEWMRDEKPSEAWAQRHGVKCWDRCLAFVEKSQEKAERARQEQRARRTLDFENNPMAMLETDPETLRFVAVNNSAIRLYGYPRDEFLRLSLPMITESAKPLAVEQAFSSKDKSFDAGQWKHRRKNGETIEVKLSAFTSEGADKLTVMATEVTERNLAQRQTKEIHSQQHARHPMSTPDGSLKPTPDQAAAHQFLTELRTRISTQPLPYQHGIETRALGSMWEVFGHARDAIKESPGCEKFAARATEVLNLVVRPLTAKWHRAFEEGRLNGRDGADEFRGELQGVQGKLRQFAVELHVMAYGTAHVDALTPDVMGVADMTALFTPLAFGFAAHTAALAEVAEQIKRDEAAGVQSRRDAVFPGDGNPAKPATGQDAIGLALSGGGIRSATFGLGVVQVLAERGLLKEVDFLSTVSGGGYTGCFLTQRLGGGEAHSTVAGPHGPDPEPVRYLRQRAKFLSPYNLKEKWSMVTATLAGMLLNWTAPLFVIVALALGANEVAARFKIDWPLVLLGCGGLSVLAMVAYGLGMRLGTKPSLVTGTILGGLLALTGIVGAGWALEAIFPDLLKNISGQWGMSGTVGAALAAIAAAAPGIIRFLPVLKDPKVRKIVLKIALWLAGLLVPLIAVLLFYTFRGLAAEHSTALAWITAALAVISIFVLNINLTAPHRLYRDGLARTFIQKSEDGTPDVRLGDINPQGTAPYHLINAALNVPSSVDSALKDRGCDFFLFSKKWMGSTAVGYRPTGEWQANGTDVDLATAMAVSGAAFSSYMGLGSMPALTALLTFLNVRLGFWIRQPHLPGLWGLPKLKCPGFTGLLREMTGFGLSEKARWLNLSDGGHIENLAVYELLRRRCKFIVCVDGEADPAFTFQGLMTLIRHAQIDFGIHITPTLDEIRPDPKTGQSKSHFHLCRIHYPEGIGLLLYIKLSVTGNESELIKRYRINNPDFPHQTTLDQFFDQEQFEAYRQLGVHAAEGLFLPALLDRREPASVPDWFRQLAKNLLEPVKARQAP